jgi:hypothetical protein
MATGNPSPLISISKVGNAIPPPPHPPADENNNNKNTQKDK